MNERRLWIDAESTRPVAVGTLGISFTVEEVVLALLQHPITRLRLFDVVGALMQETGYSLG